MSPVSRALAVHRCPGTLSADATRVLARFFRPGGEDRIQSVIARVLSLTDAEVAAEMARVRREYESRHRHFEDVLFRHYSQIAPHIAGDISLSNEKQLLLGSYFTMEYSVESAALFNPSIVPHPDQNAVPEGGVRFIMSFRATGEGHISSIVFRSGIINSDNTVLFDPAGTYIDSPELREDPRYDRHMFELKLNEIGACNDVTSRVFSYLPPHFSLPELRSAMKNAEQANGYTKSVCGPTFHTIEWLASSNYEVKFHDELPISERVIFPVSANEQNGIEDARFVLFADADGSRTYYATYTAYDGHRILPMLLETKDFASFRILTLNGKASQNKGMALFPRKVDGKYVMISRQDGENIHIMFSEHLHFWQSSQIIRRPQVPWEFVQMGNCGSPLETEAGWLLITHGVGPMRKYCMGVDLLDLDDPSKVIARLDVPILSPNECEREGYVPNVVYSCGQMIHNGELIIPYAMSDSKSAIASVSVSEVLDRLLRT